MLLFLVVASGTTRADGLSEDLLLSNARSAGEQAASELRPLELKALAAVDADAERQGDRLMLRLRSGKAKIYVDRPECKSPRKEEKCEQYSLIVHARTRGVFVVSKLYYESLEIILLNEESGEETTLRNFPIFSQSGNRLLVFLENDQELGFVVQIWRRDAGRFIQDWSGLSNSEGLYVSYRMLQWSSEDVIEIQSETSFEPPKPNVLKRFTLRHRATGWTVVEGGKAQ